MRSDLTLFPFDAGILRLSLNMTINYVNSISIFEIESDKVLSSSRLHFFIEMFSISDLSAFKSSAL